MTTALIAVGAALGTLVAVLAVLWTVRRSKGSSDAKLMEVFRIVRAQRATRIRADLLQRRAYEKPASFRRRIGAIETRPPPLQRSDVLEGTGVTEGIRTPNNRNHNPGLYR